jgi:uncharacterized membrane protein YqjE
MEPDAPGPASFVHSVHVLGDHLLALVEGRLALLAIELQEEKHRLIQTFIWICAAVFTAMMTVMFASLTLVYLFWESARLAVLCGLTLFYAAALAGLIVAFRRFRARQPNPFAATLEEIAEDRACIRNGN